MEEYNPKEGKKYDSGKPEYGLLPLTALEEMVNVLTDGANGKYTRDNWKYVDDAQYRYYNAMMRHITAWKRGQQLDPDSGRNHLAHAACCLFFLMERDIIGETEWEEKYGKNAEDKNNN